MCYTASFYWDKSEQTSHKSEVCAACLSVCTFMTQEDTRVVVIYGMPLVVDSSVYGAFGELLCMPTFNNHVVTSKVLRCKFIDCY